MLNYITLKVLDTAEKPTRTDMSLRVGPHVRDVSRRNSRK